MRRVYYFFILVVFVGCSFHQPHPLTLQEKKQLLQKRFLEYWQARTAGNYQKSWEYELPSQRFLSSFNRYKITAPGYKGTKVTLYKIVLFTPTQAVVERKIEDKKGHTFIKKDKWFFVKDNWYHKFYQSILPPKTKEEAEFQ